MMKWVFACSCCISAMGFAENAEESAPVETGIPVPIYPTGIMSRRMPPVLVDEVAPAETPVVVDQAAPVETPVVVDQVAPVEEPAPCSCQETPLPPEEKPCPCKGIPVRRISIISLFDMTEQMWKALREGQFPEAIVEVPAQAVLPLHFVMGGDVLSFSPTEEGAGLMTVLQNFYMRFLEGEVYFSSNGLQWEPFSTFFMGGYSAGFYNTEEGPFFELAISVEKRK